MISPIGWLESVVRYFAADPLRVLTLLGGSGGLAYWVQLFRNRSRLQVRILHEHSGPPRLAFEAENLGVLPMSLLPEVTVSGYMPLEGTRRLTFSLAGGTDRRLPPHEPRTFVASAPRDEEPVYLFLWYRTYTFHTTRGRARCIRRVSISTATVTGFRGRLRFSVESLFCRVAPGIWLRIRKGWWS